MKPNHYKNNTDSTDSTISYEVIYSFKVFDEIKNGETVYMLDRKRRKVKCVNDISVRALCSLLEKVEEEKSRFEFWIEKLILSVRDMMI